MTIKPSASTTEVARALSFDPDQARPLGPDSREWIMRYSTIKAAANRMLTAGLIAEVPETVPGAGNTYYLTEAARADFFDADTHGTGEETPETVRETPTATPAVPVAATRFGFDVGERVDMREVAVGDLVMSRRVLPTGAEYEVAARVTQVGTFPDGAHTAVNLYCAPICDAEGLPVPHLGDWVTIAGGWVMVGGQPVHSKVARVTDVRPLAEVYPFGEDGRPAGGAGYIVIGNTTAAEAKEGQCVLVGAEPGKPSFVQRVERIRTSSSRSQTVQLIGAAMCLADGTPLCDSRIVDRVPEEGLAVVVPVPDYHRSSTDGSWSAGIWDMSRLPIEEIRKGHRVFIADAVNPDLNGYAWRVEDVRTLPSLEDDGRPSISLSLRRVCDRLGREEGKGRSFDYGKPEGWRVVVCRPITVSDVEAARRR